MTPLSLPNLIAGLPSWVRHLGTAAVAMLVILLLLPVALRPFLDRVYYRGPASDHFDGQRFFNPDEDATGGRPSLGRVLRFLTGNERAPWPRSMPVTPGRQAAEGIDPARMVATWVGHSTVLVQVDGLAILTDPVWADRAGPWALIGPRRVRAPGIRFEDLPKVDLVLLSHNHYDHLDLPTLSRLWERDRPLIVTPLGNDTILKGQGIEAVARDWGGRVRVRPGVEVIVERAHHWGSRWSADRNRALWGGFTVTLPGGNLYFAGDTGWGDGRWPAEAARHGPIRLALMPIGAYRPRDIMASSHIDPAEAVEAFRRTGAAHALGIHWGTFRLAAEAFDDPPRDLAAALARDGMPGDRFVTLAPGTSWDVPALR